MADCAPTWKIASSDASELSSCTSSGFDLVLKLSGMRSMTEGSLATSRSPSSMRSWMTIETQKTISSMQGREIVESMYSDEVELYFGRSGTASDDEGCAAAESIWSSARASICTRTVGKGAGEGGRTAQRVVGARREDGVPVLDTTPPTEKAAAVNQGQDAT